MTKGVGEGKGVEESKGVEDLKCGSGYNCGGEWGVCVLYQMSQPHGTKEPIASHDRGRLVDSVGRSVHVGTDVQPVVLTGVIKGLRGRGGGRGCVREGLEGEEGCSVHIGTDVQPVVLTGVVEG